MAAMQIGLEPDHEHQQRNMPVHGAAQNAVPHGHGVYMNAIKTGAEMSMSCTWREHDHELG
jgi:hypothetical protein